MIRRPAEEAAVQLGPRLERPSADNQVLIAQRKLPDAVRPLTPAVRRFERHQINVVRPRRKVEQGSDRLDGSTKSWVLGDVSDPLTIDKDLSSVLERLDMS
jgi:hypothetical protein